MIIDFVERFLESDTATDKKLKIFQNIKSKKRKKSNINQ